jgi:hypothetical protein
LERANVNVQIKIKIGRSIICAINGNYGKESWLSVSQRNFSVKSKLYNLHSRSSVCPKQKNLVSVHGSYIGEAQSTVMFSDIDLGAAR